LPGFEGKEKIGAERLHTPKLVHKPINASLGFREASITYFEDSATGTAHFLALIHVPGFQLHLPTTSTCDCELQIRSAHEAPPIQLQIPCEQRQSAWGLCIQGNKLGSLAYWDDELVTKILKELKMEDIDLSTIGYSDAEMEALLAPYRDFDWKEFDEYLTKTFELDFAVLQLKVRQEIKDPLLNSIKRYAVEFGIEAKDSAHLTGQVLCRLLGVES